jgi:hypothetical protein
MMDDNDVQKSENNSSQTVENQNCKKTRSLVNSDDTLNGLPNHVLHQGQNKTNEDIIRNVL